MSLRNWSRCCRETLTRHHIRLTDVGERFICLYGAVVVRRVSEGYPLADF